MTPDQILQAFADGKWLLLAIAAITYLTRLTAPDSKFPIHIPTRWAPVVALALGQVLAILQVVAGGTTAPRAIFNGAVVSFISMGSFDVVAKAVMGDKEWPQWLKALAFVFESKTPTPTTSTPSPLEVALVQSTTSLPTPVIEETTPIPVTKPESPAAVMPADPNKPITLLPPVKKDFDGDI